MAALPAPFAVLALVEAASPIAYDINGATLKVSITDQVIAADPEGNPVPDAHNAHVIAVRGDETRNFPITNVTDEAGVTDFGAPRLDPGTQISFVATNAAEVMSQGGTPVVKPPSAAPWWWRGRRSPRVRSRPPGT